MRRWIAVFLLLFLPFQFSWSVAAAYCQHEKLAVQHFGHHEHKHQTGANGESSPASGDSDCAACHAGCVAALTGAVSPLSVTTVRTDHPCSTRCLASPPAEQPERPNWPISA